MVADLRLGAGEEGGAEHDRLLEQPVGQLLGRPPGRRFLRLEVAADTLPQRGAERAGDDGRIGSTKAPHTLADSVGPAVAGHDRVMSCELQIDRGHWSSPFPWPAAWRQALAICRAIRSSS